jgi:hypothetical protein
MHAEDRERALDWLEHQAGALGYTVYWNLVQATEPWLYVPVSVNNDKDAYDKAAALQKLEDAWNAPGRRSRPYWKFVLMPAPPGQQTERPRPGATVGDK